MYNKNQFIKDHISDYVVTSVRFYFDKVYIIMLLPW